MEFSERCIQTLEKEGFLNISEQSRGSLTGTQSFPAAATPTALIVTDGSLTVTFAATLHSLYVGDRLDIPPAVPYSITAGPTGYQLIFGEN